MIHGEQRGAKLGIPTANLEISSRMSMPAMGIYAVWAEVEGERHPAAVNLGVRPTFGENRLMTEAHLLDFSGDLYGKRLKLGFIGDRIRPETKFGSVDESVGAGGPRHRGGSCAVGLGGRAVTFIGIGLSPTGC